MKLHNLKAMLIIALSACLSVPAYSQKKFLPGYVINNGDTINGMIEYADWDRNPDKILFRDDAGNVHSYRPGDIEKFSVLNDVYVSATLDIETSPFETSKLLSSPDLQFKTVNTFLRTLVNGRKNLYYYTDETKKSHFIIGEQGRYEDLVYKRYVSYTENGVPHVIESKRFVGQLTVYLNDCPSIQTELNDIRYQKSSLIKLFDRYHNCTGSPINFTEEKRKIMIEYGVMGGVSLARLNFSAKNNVAGVDPVVEAVFENSVDFSGGVFANIIFPRAKRVVLAPELLFTMFSFKGENYQQLAEDYSRQNFFSLKTGYIKFNTVVGYRLPLKKISLHVNTGFSITKLLYTTANDRESHTTTFNSTVTQQQEFVDLKDRGRSSFIIGAGGSYKRITLEVRNERGMGFHVVGNNFVSSPVQLYYALLKYRIK